SRRFSRIPCAAMRRAVTGCPAWSARTTRRRRRTVLTALAAAVSLGLATAAVADPLPSWRAGAAKRAIVDFVGGVTTFGTPTFVPVAQRIAVFDNDGTLWAEQPLYFQMAFAVDRVKALAPEHPEWRETEPFASILAGDVKRALAGGDQAVVALLTA